ncbi:MAG: hypothetical protein ACK4E3_09290 [Brevundimonas sp.]|jgi:hypothetical protein|uniref:hypothetical protein n=1 Tax=Brevundimonas sp. TaxID=1871086 RepID=UPI003919D30B
MLRTSLAPALGACALMLALPALGQEAQPAGTEPVSAEQVAAARAHADAMIASAGAGQWFENITGADGVPLVRHRPSGMTCRFIGGPSDRIHILSEPDDDLAAGDDVACNTQVLDISITTYATRLADQYTAEEIMQDSMAAIAERWPTGTMIETDLVGITLEGYAAPFAGGYRIPAPDGGTYMTLVYVQHDGPWSFKLRATGPDEEDTNVLSAMVLAMGLPEK